MTNQLAAARRKLDDDKAQSDHLLLLVGSNPLPNTVAALLLTRQDGTAWLLQSRASKGVAHRLQSWLASRGVKCEIFKDAGDGNNEAVVDEVDPVDVTSVVRTWAKNLSEEARVGVHYTGGTKVMSVHARRTTRAIRRGLEGVNRAVCSYLNPDTLMLHIDGRATPFDVGASVSLSVQDMLALHGYDWALERDRHKFADHQFDAELRRLDHRVRITVDEDAERVRRTREADDAQSLQDILIQALREVKDAAGAGAAPFTFVVGVQLRQHAAVYFDALASQGYQLYAFVCSTSTDRAELKRELFQCTLRARRIGGDEARAALICRHDDARGILAEMSTDFDFPTQRGARDVIKVFGGGDLPDLSRSLNAWVRQRPVSRASAPATNQGAQARAVRPPAGLEQTNMQLWTDDDYARWERFQVDHLLVLVGGNALPNAVAARLLLRPHGYLHLIYTSGSAASAQHLARWARSWPVEQAATPVLHPFDVATLLNRVEVIAKAGHDRRVGLHYTGGTKQMSALAYDAVAELLPGATFSYLDARSLSLIMHPADPLSVSGPAQRQPVGADVRLTLPELAQDLHGWTLRAVTNTLPDPLLEVAHLLRDMHVENGVPLEKWDTLVIVRWRRQQKDNPHKRQNGKPSWLDEHGQQLPLNLSNSPHLAQVVEAIRTAMGLPDGSYAVSLERLADLLGLPSASGKSDDDRRESVDRRMEEAFSWFEGRWLETIALEALLEKREVLNLVDVGANLILTRPMGDGRRAVKFEFDVAAMRGPQLFALPCGRTTDSRLNGHARLVDKLFEACVRARQIGGDEACIALVCCSDDPATLEREVRDDFDGDEDEDGRRIKVFGRRHLAQLPEHLAAWIAGRPVTTVGTGQ